MRITSSSTYTTMRDSLAASLSRVNEVQSQLGTNRRINRMSDDPVGAATALRYRSLETEQDVFAGAADNASTWLGAADTALQDVSGALAQIRGLAIEAVNGSLSDDARTALHTKITALRDELVDLANAPQDGQALFGGFRPTAIAKAADGTWSYSGDDGKVKRRVGAGVTVDVNVDGRTAFGFDQPAGKDLLSVVDSIAAHALSGDTAALQADQVDLAGRTQGVLGALGRVGATVNRIESARARGQEYTDAITAERSQIEDIDLAQAIMQLTSAQTGYQAALGAAARSNLPSLADFLR